MTGIIPDFLRGMVTNVGTLLIMAALIQPKKSGIRGLLVLVPVFVINAGIDIYCYTSAGFKELSWLDLIIFTVFCFAIKPFFQDTMKQWLFAYISTQNVNLGIMIVSFVLSRYLPYPVYANTLIRLILFAVLFVVFLYVIRPVYRQSMEHWTIFLVVAAIICFCYVIVFLSSDNIKQMLMEHKVPLMLLVLVATTAYFSLFYTLNIMSRTYRLQEDNLKYQSRQQLMQLSISNLEQQLQVLDEKSEMERREAHDRRNYQNTILELIRTGEIAEAERLLTPRVQEPVSMEVFCENRTVNAVISNMIRQAKEQQIEIDRKLDIPKKLPVDDIEFAMVVANLLENAIHSVDRNNRKIRFVCRFVGTQLALEIVNHYTGSVLLNKEGYPVSTRSGHGIGTKNVVAFAQKHNAQLIYEAADGVFRVRMLIG